jgi:hypothetical protein
LARLAIILREGSLTERQVRLGRMLDFFGVPWQTVDAPRLADMEENAQEQVVFGSAQAVAATLKPSEQADHAGPRQAAFYAYTDDDLGASLRGLRSLCGHENFSLQKAPAGNLRLRVSGDLAGVAGPMAGLEVSSQLRREDAIVLPGGTAGQPGFATLISAGGAPVFFLFQHNGVPVFFCASSHMVDIDQEVGPGFYDVKDHFCSVVPLVMFIRFMFPDVAWGRQELGACLIVDDPPLRERYGFCDFGKLRDLMRRHGFTTNIAFIPWNWRRTSSAAGDFFRNESGHFSVSIHGCDHIGAEFGATSLEVLHKKARLAQCRMRNHEVRTGVHHDPIMIFPQGVFSSVCPEVLKRNGFLAAVNTETVPVDPDGARTRIRDVWDVAIMAYSGFPVFTRRYAFHGLENFAFDLLLGKPCLIVSHHDFFKDDGAVVIEFIEKLHSLNCSLRWRPLGEVIRRACRRRASGEGVEEVEMYANELVVDNPSDQMVELRVRKRENQVDLVAEILSDGKPATWAAEVDHLVLSQRIGPHNEKHIQVVYREQAEALGLDRSLRFELSVAVRRILSEFRDEYLSRSRSLTTTATNLKNALTKAS